MLKILARDDRMTLKIPYAAVQEWGVARDMAHGLPNADMAAWSANNESQFALEVESGNLNINGGTQFRADLMPYGGLKDRGMGKEGPRYAIEAKVLCLGNVFPSITKPTH